jgi:prophage regulatory protein
MSDTRPPAQLIAAPRRALRLPAVCHKTGLSRSTIYALEKAGNLPKRFRLGPNSSAWWEHEIDAWLEARAAAPIEAPRNCKPGPGRGHKKPVDAASVKAAREGRKAVPA